MVVAFRVVDDHGATTTAMSKRRKRPPPKSSSAVAWTWISLGWFLRAGSLALAFYYIDDDGAILIVIVPFAVAYGMIRHGQKMRAVRAEALMAQLKEGFLEAFIEHNGLRS